MKRAFLICLLLSISAGWPALFGQDNGKDATPAVSGQLFADQTPLVLSLRESMKSLKKDTNDSTYLKGQLLYSPEGGRTDSIELKVRARGIYRRSQCYFAPLKLKFRNSDIEGTIFEGNKELKLVLPCMIGSASDDYVLKEFMAYKLFETLSPYYYKTRLVRMEFTEIRGKRERNHELLGFLLEDHGTLARRMGGKRIRRNMPPLMQDAEAAVQNNLFQYGIGNTDFSVRKQHNQRLYYTDEKYVSIPYDFDMCGLVNAPYATVSNVQTLDRQPTDVRDRVYKGYVRDTAIVQQVRRQFLDARPRMREAVASLEPYFRDPKQYKTAQAYLEEFFKVLEDDRKFEREILKGMRD